MAQRIDVKDLNIYYSDFLAVADVEMSVEPRSVTAFIGPSGCGKSTFLRTLNRMHEVIPGAHVQGEVAMDGVDLYGADIDPVAVRRQVGMVFQRPNPFPTMSIADNVLAGIRLNNKRISKSDAADVVETSLRERQPLERGQGPPEPAGLRALRRSAAAPVHRPRHRGQAAGAAHGRAVLGARPDLDARHRGPDRGAQGDYTIVIVTHNMQQAARVSDRTAFFNLAATGQPGRLVEIDDTSTIFSSPREQATEDYISGRFG